MITWLLNLLTGRMWHWNKANNDYLSTLFERAKTFPPAIKPLFTHFTAASYALVDSLVGPGSGSKRIIKIDLKDITAEQFRSIHNLNIWTFVALFGAQNPQLKDALFAACKDFIGIRELEKQSAQDVLRMKSIDAGTISSMLFRRILSILGRDDTDGLSWVRFAPRFTGAYTYAIEVYTKEMNYLAG